MSESVKSCIWLKGGDGTIIQVEEEVAMVSPVLRKMFKANGVGSCENKAILLPQQVKSYMIRSVFKFCTEHLQPQLSNEEREGIDESFMEQALLNPQFLSDLRSAAQYLQLDRLVNLACCFTQGLIDLNVIFGSHAQSSKQIKDSMNHTQQRLRTKLKAMKQEKQNVVVVKEDDHVDERSVDELLSFINGDKVAETSSGTKKKKKNKKKTKIGHISEKEDKAGSTDEDDRAMKEDIDRDIEELQRILSTLPCLESQGRIKMWPSRADSLLLSLSKLKGWDESETLLSRFINLLRAQ